MSTYSMRTENHYFQVPNDVIDNLMHLLTPQEFMTLMFAIRNIEGWVNKDKKKLYPNGKRAIAFDAFMNGFSDRDHGTGLKKTAQRTAIKGLCDHGIMESGTKTQDGNVYSLSFILEPAKIQWGKLEERLGAKQGTNAKKGMKAREYIGQGTTDGQTNGTTDGQTNGTTDGQTTIKKEKERGNKDSLSSSPIHVLPEPEPRPQFTPAVPKGKSVLDLEETIWEYQQRATNLFYAWIDGCAAANKVSGKNYKRQFDENRDLIIELAAQKIEPDMMTAFLKDTYSNEFYQKQRGPLSWSSVTDQIHGFISEYEKKAAAAARRQEEQAAAIERVPESEKPDAARRRELREQAMAEARKKSA